MIESQVTETLETLRDLEGVLGSFLIGPKGSILAQDLPSYFGSAAYDIGPRAQRLQEALLMAEGDVSQCVLRFGDHKVALRATQKGLLTIVTNCDVNMPSLRMAMSLVAQRLERQRLVVEPSSPPPPTVRPTAAPKALTEEKERPSRPQAAPEASDAVPQKKRAIYFRGKRVQ